MRFDWWKRAQDCISQGALTNSKHPESLIKGCYPTHIAHGHGAYLYGPDDHKYLDFICGLGTNLLGYGNDHISRQLIKKMYGGFSHSLPTTQEVITAEKLKEVFVFVDQWKFLKSGSEACSAAVKIARAYQGVENGNEKLHKMWYEEITKRISQKQIEEAGCERLVQNLREGISKTASCNGDQEKSPEKICEDNLGANNRNESCSNKMAEGEGKRESQSAISAAQSIGYEKNGTDAVREMWKQRLASAPSRLQQTPEREMAMQLSSRPRTPKFLVLSDGYHGIHDMYVSLVSPHAGVPRDYGILPLTGNEDLIEIAAAVIVEPVIVDDSKDRIKYLSFLRSECTKHDCMLIFDEVITGMRYKKFGVSNCYGIVPDLVVIGKAIANGMPLAAVGGKKHIMEDRKWFVSSTYAGEVMSLAACYETVTLMQNNPNYNINDLWREGNKFVTAFNEQPGGIKINGYATRGVFEGDAEEIAIFFQEAARADILFCKSWFYNFDLVQHKDDVIDICLEIKERIVNKAVKLEFDLPKSPFAQEVRNGSKTNNGNGSR